MPEETKPHIVKSHDISLDSDYVKWIHDVKQRYITTQIKTAVKVNYNLIPDLTVRENVEVVRDITEKPLDIDELLDNLELSKYKHKFPKELSGGQQQRTAIARALVKNPAILLCDELTGALDSKSSRSVLNMLARVNEKYKTTIIIITHNEGISGMADRVIRIHDGEIQQNLAGKERQPVSELAI